MNTTYLGAAVATRHNLLSTLYWETDTSLDTIIESIGFVGTKQALVKEAGEGIMVGFSCRTCAGEIRIPARSGAIAFLNNQAKRARRNGGEPVLNDCRDCTKAALKAYYVEHEKREAARAQRKRELMTMPYRDFLQTEEWQATRKSALYRAKYSCQTCSSKGKLHVHHRTYVRRGAELNSDLIVLCADCHLIFHEKGKLANGGRAA